MKPTVLLAEDNAESRYLFSFVLERTGIEVLRAVNGLEALEILSDHTPDLMILDIQMPELDGFKTLARLRADPRFKQTPIIGLSAHDLTSDREKAYAQGFTHYIEKPVEIDRFLAEVRSLLPKQVALQ